MNTGVRKSTILRMDSEYRKVSAESKMKTFCGVRVVGAIKKHLEAFIERGIKFRIGVETIFLRLQYLGENPGRSLIFKNIPNTSSTK
jgi:hypothetical protein